MRILSVFEWLASVLIIAGIVLGLGKVAVDQVVYLATRPAFGNSVIYEPSDAEKLVYLAHLRERGDDVSLAAARVMESRMSGSFQVSGRRSAPTCCTPKHYTQFYSAYQPPSHQN